MIPSHCCEKDALRLSSEFLKVLGVKEMEEMSKKISRVAYLGILVGEFSLSYVDWTACHIQDKLRASMVLFHYIMVCNV